MSSRRTVLCRAAGCGWRHEADSPEEAETWVAVHQLAHSDHEVDIVRTISFEEAFALPDTTRPTWCAICADETCGWEMRARTEPAAQDFKAIHLREHPDHHVTIVCF